MTIRLQAWIDSGPRPPDTTVVVEGPSLASAVRAAVRGLGLGVGQTRSSVETAPGEWRWDWSGTVLHVRVILHTDPLYVPLTAAFRGKRVLKEPLILDLRGDRPVTVHLSRAASAELDRGVAECYCDRSAYIEALLLDAAARRRRAGVG